MNLFLDTTIQIDRFLSSEERKKSIEEILKNNNLYSSTYVLGEYNNLLNDFLTLYSLFIQEKNIGKTAKRITEKAFGRSQSRMVKLFGNIVENCDDDIDLILDSLDVILNQIQNMFYYRLETPLLDETKCDRANRKIIYEEEVPTLSKAPCRKKDNVCDICEFWCQRKLHIENLLNANLSNKIIDILNLGKDNVCEMKGNNCKTLGDTIICLEAKSLGDGCAVCSSNKKDFKPICDCIELELHVPTYS